MAIPHQSSANDVGLPAAALLPTGVYSLIAWLVRRTHAYMGATSSMSMLEGSKQNQPSGGVDDGHLGHRPVSPEAAPVTP